MTCPSQSMCPTPDESPQGRVVEGHSAVMHSAPYLLSMQGRTEKGTLTFAHQSLPMAQSNAHLHILPILNMHILRSLRL